MPWSPLKYTEEVFNDLKRQGYENEVTTETLSTAIMRATSLVRSPTIKNVVKAFEQLGHIKLTADGIWKINYWKPSKKETIKEEVDEIDYLNSMLIKGGK